MNTIIRPVLELTVILPGMLLAYLPVKGYLKQSPFKLFGWLFPLLAVLCILGGILCFFMQIPTRFLLLLLLLLALFLYHQTLRVSLWKSGSIFMAVCAVFACINSLSIAVNAIMTANLNLTENELWFCTDTGLFYNLLCLLFVAAAWYPASHLARTMAEDDNFAQTWYVFWILPLVFIGLNLFMVPKYRITLYTGRVLQGYIVISLVLLLILVLFYAMFFLIASSLNRNARLQQENHFLSLQQARYDTLRSSIEEARQARHDMRHHFLQLSSLAAQGDLERIKAYLSNVTSKIPSPSFHFCENQAADSVVSYYCDLAGRESIPFASRIALPEQIAIDEVDLCLVLSNLLENALEASLKTAPERRNIQITACLRHASLLLIQVENSYDGKITEKNHIFQSSKRKGNGIGIQSIRHICEKNGGNSHFVYENGIFTAQLMLRLKD